MTPRSTGSADAWAAQLQSHVDREFQEAGTGPVEGSRHRDATLYS